MTTSTRSWKTLNADSPRFRCALYDYLFEKLERNENDCQFIGRPTVQKGGVV